MRGEVVWCMTEQGWCNSCCMD